jgi:hypothetical protein
MGTNETQYAALSRSRTTVVPPRPSVASLRKRLEEIRHDMVLEEAAREIAANRRRIERLSAMPPVHRPALSSDSVPSSWASVIYGGVGEIVGQVSDSS